MNRERDLTGPGQVRAIRDLLQTLFVCELLRPSSPLWFYFAWVSDIDIIDNTARQFASLFPDWPAAPIRLSTVLDAILSRGGTINVMLRDVPHNESFIRRLELLRTRHGGAINWLANTAFHEKGMAGVDYVLEGSMNLTFSGMNVNNERLTLRCDPATVAERHITLRELWDNALA